MSKLDKGMQAIDFTFDTPWTENNRFSRVLGDKKTILIFHRFYGCRICLLDMSKIIECYEKFTSNNAQVIIVLQTEPSIIRGQDKKEAIPLMIACDPEHQLYKLYGVAPSEELITDDFMKRYQNAVENRMVEFTNDKGIKNQLFNEDALIKLYEALDKGMVKINNNGKQSIGQLPATFIIESNGMISFVHYGKHAGDIPTVNELIALL
jgi:peroxiredoxin